MSLRHHGSSSHRIAIGSDCINIPSSIVPIASPRISGIHGSGSAGSGVGTVAAVPATCSLSTTNTPLPPPTIEFPPPPPRNQDSYVGGTSSNSSTATQCSSARDVRDAARMKAVQRNLPLPIPPSSAKPKLQKLG